LEIKRSELANLSQMKISSHHNHSADQTGPRKRVHLPRWSTSSDYSGVPKSAVPLPDAFNLDSAVIAQYLGQSGRRSQLKQSSSQMQLDWLYLWQIQTGLLWL